MKPKPPGGRAAGNPSTALASVESIARLTLQNQPESPAGWLVPPVTPAERSKLLAIGITPGSVDFINRLPPYQRAWWRRDLPAVLRARKRTVHVLELRLGQ